MDPIKFEIELDLNDWARGQVVYDYDGEPSVDRAESFERFVTDRVVDTLAREIKREISKQVTEVVVSTAKELAEQQVHAVMAGPIQLTDSYGTKRGEAKTLLELVTEEASKIFSKQVDSYSRKTVLQKIIADEVNTVFTREVSAAMNEAKTKAIEAVRAKAADMLAQEMSRP